ncbi:glycoside hydrolase family 18 protein [Sphingobacterium paludis]|uniref:Glycosyl hydrolase family 18 (Putative chitinase) n=1 Tax=Sphingobacterium paludis TaxID=1476465 RepID=A0A4R7CSD4_9SPHI|nr:glycosyl hydrolase family 18 protein [Sphingobacterium paludis]TDS09744.1 glycosyl hydrolase family 18 (putative chitinase) [Sphingobacterium paludis]
MSYLIMQKTAKFRNLVLGLSALLFLSCKQEVLDVAPAEEALITSNQDQLPVASAEKSTGIKIVSCMEVNDTNPLNNLSLTLKNSGKPLVDMVILFSSNINYDQQTGKVRVTHNDNVTHLLENKDKYLKPLKDRGMKVILSILGNHDRAGVANLDEQTARDFASEIRNVCATYDLDGVFFDDEYSRYENPPPPGFVTPSYRAAARLCYETKMAMPEKLVMVYVYSLTGDFGGANAIPQAQAGAYIDYALHDYLASFDLSTRYPGLPRSGWGMSSGEYALNRYPTTAALQNLRSGGYGAHLIFAFDPNRANFSSRQMPALQNIASILFDDELVFDTTHRYTKDW